ncbi:uncharacterized protein MICPUCDRAFT_53151 [Micromonas pusilla CCMP1545]|uniref:Predicted protein n=1 Tax=Micromonas pusilla (strain CCMP1545) TaxID=564608 RepID=C1N644_MICPC|nr:uncharacterized protein MICPUCDRAFT_53151 [Micromonas pusilla CCMP1545]EEH52606.1 predicted protein [Micromonas pusilla CCMP1545]|eukprot:XP_003063470.1 predicted protein [Micromonas pusilla CCMP1545]
MSRPANLVHRLTVHSPTPYRARPRRAQDPTPNTCVTVCGSSGIDACTEACQRSVCSAPHSVPSWNDQCNKRCTQECLRGRT